MPPYLAMPYFHLSKLPLTTKLVLTGFSVSLTAGFAFVAVAYLPKLLEPEKEQARHMLQEDAGHGESFRRHFAPQEVTRRVMEKQAAEPAEIEHAVRTNQEGQRRKAFDIIHPHSFLMPVVFFILCHLMEMTPAPRWAKISLYASAFVGMVLTVTAPVVILYATWMALPSLVGLYLMLACFTAMALAPVGLMWFSKAA